jgi:hypothetical protein
VHEVTSDVAFRERLTKAVHDVNVALEAEHQVQITQLVDLERYTLNDTASALSVYTLDDISAAVRARPGRLRALRVLHRKSVLYGALVWARAALDRQERCSGAGSPGPSSPS